MADQEKVLSETTAGPVRIRAGIVIGWDDKGEFQVSIMDKGVNALNALFYLDVARSIFQAQINPNRAPETGIVAARAMPPRDLVGGNGRR